MDVTVQHMHDVLSLKIPSPANMKPTIYYLINNMNYILSFKAILNTYTCYEKNKT